MPRSVAAVLGVLAVLPLVYGLVFLVRFWFLVPGVNPSPWPLSEYVNWHVAMMVLSGLLILVFLAITFLSGRVPRNRMLVWTLLLLIGGMFVFPAFWYVYVWKPSRRNL